jgi:LacI family sucrose operon transcriptional repressor
VWRLYIEAFLVAKERLVATIKDVAREAGVSVTTVSRVLNKRGYLSVDVKRRVADAMCSLDYHPNDLARSLQTQKSHIIGLIVPSVKNPFFGEIAHYIEGYAYNNGYKILICNSLQDREKEREYIEMLKRSQVDGIIMGSHVADTADYAALRLPLVSLDRQLGANIPYVCCDNYAGGVLATRHLLERGCKRLMHFCSGIRVDIIANNRTTAFFDVCKETDTPHLYVELPESSLIDFHEEVIIRNALTIHPECDGVFCSNDVTATATVSIAAELGRIVGGDIKIIGFDGNFFPTLMRPRLSTIRQPVDAISRYAVEHLLRLMRGEMVPTQTMLRAALKVGETT